MADKSLAHSFGTGPSQAEPEDVSALRASVPCAINGQIVDVDAAIAPLVCAINAAGIETVASCSGHGFRPGNIALRDGREIIIARNYAEGRRIDRLFPLDINGDRR